MKERMKKILSVALAGVLVFGAVKGTVYAIGNEKKEKETVKKEQEAEVEELKTDGSTVYVFTEENGKVQNVIATDDILDDAGKDNDDLKKEIPVEINIKYILDGKEIKPEKLEGKSGHLVIRYDYKNNDSRTMNVNGHNEKINTPYAMVTGIIFEDECFKNVEADNAKIIDDGSRTIVAGIALPGLQYNLHIGKDVFDVPDHMEISADVENYEHPEALTLATSQVFTEIDTEKLNDVEGLKGEMDKLEDAFIQLTDGSKQLYDGIVTLSEKSAELKDGVDKLYAGSSDLKNGISTLDNGAVDLQAGAQQLVAGLGTLTSNNKVLQDGALQVYNTLLSVGSDQIHANENFKDVPELTRENYGQVLGGIIAQLDENVVYQTALDAVTKEVESHRDEVVAAVTAEVRKVVEAKVNEAVKAEVVKQVTEGVEAQRDVVRAAVLNKVMPGVSLEQYDALVEAGKIPEEIQAAFDDAVENAIQGKIAEITEEKMASDEVKALTESKIEEAMKGEEAQNNISAFTEAKIQELIAGGMQKPEVQEQIKAASEGLKAITDLKTSLDSYDAFYNGLITYTNGVAEAQAGAQALKSGTDTLKAGSSKLLEGSSMLYDGLGTLSGNTPALIEGVDMLKDGSGKLADGIVQVNDEGINKLIEAYNGDIAPLLERVKATVNAAKEHDTFAGVSKEKDSEIKFIFRTK